EGDVVADRLPVEGHGEAGTDAADPGLPFAVANDVEDLRDPPDLDADWDLRRGLASGSVSAAAEDHVAARLERGVVRLVERRGQARLSREAVGLDERQLLVGETGRLAGLRQCEGA